MHIHMDLVGGLAGDMFVGAILDCFPDLARSLPGQLDLAGFRDLVELEIKPADDGILTGTQFKVVADQDAEGHHHRHYSDIRKIICESGLDENVKHHALGIFEIIAAAEASIHGKPIEKIAFHEVGAWDSIADIVCAGVLIDTIGATSWSVSKLPLGRGQVKTAHGMLPVPAPATALILEGFEFFDDGLMGERITPTGAAILKHLSTTPGLGPGVSTLRKSGYGFGTKRFPGISNVVRMLIFDERQSDSWDYDQVLQLEFEIDDQTPEEMAISADRLRDTPGVLDVTQQLLLGKKGRHTVSFRILGQLDVESEITRACFEETSTLGIRRQVISRSILPRQDRLIKQDGQSYRVKIARRPSGDTVKCEADDAGRIQGNYATRTGVRHAIEGAARDQAGSEPDDHSSR
ncbi:MAG: LarC family nickel insertion protein [Pseudomonadales bacterium]